jgi:uncharacterized membrane protein YcjF (UPF0283 family)
MTEAAPAEQAVEAEKKKRLFHRIPTSLLVTVIGIALTAWLLPAFTHQWNDRQKAQQLKAALAAQIAAATSQALIMSKQDARRTAELRATHKFRNFNRDFAAETRLADTWLEPNDADDVQARI